MDYTFATPDLAGMQTTQDEHMMDTCTIGTYTTSSTDDYGAPIPTWPAGSPISCGFRVFRVDEVLGQTMVPTADAQVRLPIGTSFGPKDRITITHRHGVNVTDQAYGIVGDAKRGPSGLVVDLRRVSDGS